MDSGQQSFVTESENVVHVTIVPFNTYVILMVECFATVKRIILTVNGTVVDNTSETNNVSPLYNNIIVQVSASGGL